MIRLGTLVVPLAMVLIIGTGLLRGVPVFDRFVEGAREGLSSGVRILPALVALVTAVGMFRASGALDLVCSLLEPVGRLLGLPAQVLPLCLIRPISGSGAMAVFSDLLRTYGADSLIGRIASVLQGSTETTFYTIALYYGAAGIHDTRHTIPSALSADLSGFIMSALAVRLLFG